MTFTEAAVEVLRRAGKPLHYREIAELAIKENLLSHVGQDPEVTMGQRLAAMAKREEERKVVAIAPEGTFALLEWSPPPEVIVEAVAPPLQPADSGEATYRPREREPRAIHAQARKRLAELQAEHEDGYEEAEAERRKQDEKRHKKRFPPPAEVVFEALAVRQTGAVLAEIAQQLLGRNLLSEALCADLPSLVAALLEDNRRRTEAGRKPAFIIDGERVTLVEFPPPSAVAELAADKGPRPAGAQQLAQDARKAAARALRKRLADLDTSGFEQVCTQLLDKLSMRDVRVAKRSKEGPLYLARQRRGVSELRVAVKLVRGGREITRQDVTELRRDLTHYSAQLGLVLAAGESAREARSESSAAGQSPVALYTGEALADEMIAARVGVVVQTIEVPDVDEAFFATLSRREDRRDRRDREERQEPQRREEPPAEPQLSEAQLAVEEMHTAPAPLHPSADQPSVAQEMRSDVPPLESEVNAPLADIPSVAAAAGGDLERVSASPSGTPEEPARETRRPKKGREDKPRATTAAEQAWGQPAGTMRFAPPPGPTVAAQRKTEATPSDAADAPAAPAAESDSRREESPAPPPAEPTGGEGT